MKFVAAKCPNCGAQIKVDENKDSCVCEFCKSTIVIDDAIRKYKIEISGAFEVKNLPKLENFLKLGNRHYENKEYSDAYEQYTKACELDPDNYEAVLRKGISKALCTNYNNFEINVLTNAMHNAYDILVDREDGKEKINKAIVECNSAINYLKEFIISFYDEHKFSFKEVSEFITRMDFCLDALRYLYRIIQNNDHDVKLMIIDNIIDTINYILDNKYYYSKSNNELQKTTFILNKKYEDSLIAEKKSYIKEISKIKPDHKHVQGLSLYNMFNICCYIMIGIAIFGIIFTIIKHKYMASFIWGLVAILFLPPLKNFILRRDDNLIISIYLLRTVTTIVAIYFTQL